MLFVVALLLNSHALIAPVSPVDTLTSGLASIARLPYGTDVAEARRASLQPQPALTLYEVRDCQ